MFKNGPGLTLTYCTLRSNLVTVFSIGKMITVIFSETIAACDSKVGRCRQIIELMKVCEYRRSMSFLDLGPRSVTYENFVCNLLDTWR